MFDFRDVKTVDLAVCNQIHPDSNTYLYSDEITGKKYVLKFYNIPFQESDIYFINEFKKLVLLSGEPEIANVFGLVSVAKNNELLCGYLMDYIDGNTLKSYIEFDNYNYGKYIEILVQLTSGLEKSHYYDVFHNDLHLENVMIDSFNNLKIIDFLWNDFRRSKEDKFEKDIVGFKIIENNLFNQLSQLDREQAFIIHKICQDAKIFKNLSKSLIALDEVTLDISLLDSKSINVLSKIIVDLPSNFKLKQVLKISEIEIPDFLSSNITEQEKNYAIKNKNGVRLKYDDSRKERIKASIDAHLTSVFFQLKQTHLCDFTTRIVNTGEEFYGPYSLEIEIEISIKLIKWARLNSIFGFFSNEELAEIDEILLYDEYEA